MRAYLLGKLEAAEADALEDRYFADREVLLRLQACERELLDDYFAGRLSAADRRLIEERYPRVPELNDRLEDARRRHARPETASRFRAGLYRPVLAALVAVAVAAGAWWSLRPNHPPVARDASPILDSSAFLAVALTPGVTKGNGSGAHFRIPNSNTKVRFLLEVPAADYASGATAFLDRVEDDGGRTRIRSWPQSLRMESAPGGYRVTLGLDSTLLARADYVITLRGPDGSALESYLVRAEQGSPCPAGSSPCSGSEPPGEERSAPRQRR